jgi:hypothetical protein
MDHTQLWGVLLVVAAGLSMGGSGWPIKLMTTFRYEHLAFTSMVFNVLLIWTITLLFCPHAIEAYQTIDPKILLRSNLFSMLWGVANILFYLCLIRIGFSLTGGILTGVGVSIGVIMPMIFKGSGLFSHAPDVLSPAGYAIMAGVVVMLVGVLLASLAGYAKHRPGVGATATASGGSGFTLGLIMVVVAGVLSAGISFSFVYSQGPIVTAMKAHGAADTPANVAVWAVGLAGGLLINILYPAYLLTKNKTWPILAKSPLQIFYCLLIAIGVTAAIVLMGQGMILLGVLGASVGFGVQQAMQMLGGQAVGFISGEWRGVPRKVLLMMLGAIVLLIAAACIMAYGNSLAG